MLIGTLMLIGLLLAGCGRLPVAAPHIPANAGRPRVIIEKHIVIVPAHPAAPISTKQLRAGLDRIRNEVKSLQRKIQPGVPYP